MTTGFQLSTEAFGERAQLISVTGCVDGDGAGRVLDALYQAAAASLVIDLSCVAISAVLLRDLVEGMVPARGRYRLVIVSTRFDVREAVEACAPDFIDVVTSWEEALAVLDRGPKTPAHARAELWSMRVQLSGVEGARCVQVCESSGGLRLVGTAARWEIRRYGPRQGLPGRSIPWFAYKYAFPATMLCLVVLDDGAVIGAFDAHLIRAIETWLLDGPDDDDPASGTLGATVFMADQHVESPSGRR